MPDINDGCRCQYSWLVAGPGSSSSSRCRSLWWLGVGLLAVTAACGQSAVESPVAAPADTAESDTLAGESSAEAMEPAIARSVFQIKADRCASPENAWTTGFAIEPQTIVTVAHALISTRGVTVIDVDGNEHPVEVAYVDDLKDIALLRLLDTTAPVVTAAEVEAAGDVWTVTFKQKDEAPVVKPAAVVDLMEVTMDGQGAREAIKLTADISVGDSGGPVVTDDGRLLGMIFATTIDAQTGWAIAENEVTAAVEAKNAAPPEVVPPTCTEDPTEEDDDPPTETSANEADPDG